MTSPKPRSVFSAVAKTRPNEAQRYFREIALLYDGDECLIWPFYRNAGGYGLLRDQGRSRDAHRVICEVAHGLPPTQFHEAAHTCGNGHLGCVTKGHLVWKTHRENEADKISHGTILRGESNANAKLTRDNVLSIRAELSGHRTKTAIAAQFGVSIRTVSQIQSGNLWGWLA
jgi:hypothetical protein